MTTQPPLFHLQDYHPTPYAIPHTDLIFKLEDKKARIISCLTIERRPQTPVGTPLILDGDELTLIKIRLNGEVLNEKSYQATGQKLEIFTPPAEVFTIEITTEIVPEYNKKLMGLYRSNGVFCTQCEAQGFRRITYFYDRPDVLSTFTVRIEADQSSAPVLLSNGNLIERNMLEDNRHFAIWDDPFPKPCYLFALVAGNLDALHDNYITGSDKQVDLAIYVEPGKTARAAYAMDALKRSMRWDEEKFGREYDLSVFNIVAVSDFNMGAMENKGLNIFNDRYILSDQRHETDSDFANVERVVAHEYFHNWTGNRITCRDWFQLCLKEGLTVYRDQEFVCDARSRAVNRIENVRLLQAAQFPEDAGPLAHPVRPRQYSEINNFYTTTIYEKGAEVVRMIATWLGQDLFRKGMDLYFARHDGQACTIENFIACFAEVSAYDFSQFMLWYEQAGTPHVSAEFDYDATAGTFTLTLEQTIPPTPGQDNKQPMLIPVRFALLDEDGKEMVFEAKGEINGDVLLLKEKRQTFHFSNLHGRPTPSLLRGFSAPIELDTPLDAQDLAFLARHDSDEVNRWMSLNQIVLDELVSAAQGKEIKNQTREILIDLIGKIAVDETLEPAYRAMALTLPAEAEIARMIAQDVDPDLVHRARKQLLHDIAKAHYNSFSHLREDLSDDNNYSPDTKSAGKRALANILLDYVSIATNDPGLANNLYICADNMTNRIAALRILCQRFWSNTACNEALADFEQSFKTDALVMDKWFSVQMLGPAAQVLDRVKDLMCHPLFASDNPNRIRALIGTFASANQTGFHRLDGASYQFFADFILQTDQANPQLAARMLTLLRSWRCLESRRRDLIETVLKKIATTPNLSTDTADIINRMLEYPC